MNNQELFREFCRLMPGTTQKQFENLISNNALKETVKGHCPDLLHRISLLIHRERAENREPISAYDVEASLLILGE